MVALDRGVARFVAFTTIPEVIYPSDTDIQRFLISEFADHCASRGQIFLPNLDAILRDYKGIIVAQTVLEPVVDGPTVLSRNFTLTYSAIGVEWMGIRHENGEWITQEVGKELLEQPSRASLLGHVINKTDGEIRDTRPREQGVYILAAGRFQEPDYTIKFNVQFDGISLVE
jgi:hypothetical protein